MLVIRLLRTGKKKQPFYKIVVTDKKNPPQAGRFVEQIGFLNPLTKEKKIDGERAKYWIEKGAGTSETVYNLLIGEKVLEGSKMPKHKKSKKEKQPKETPLPEGQPKEEVSEEKEITSEEKKEEEKQNEESSS